jgi:hypothetical protein
MSEIVSFTPAFPVVCKYGRLGSKLERLYEAGNAVALKLHLLRKDFNESPVEVSNALIEICEGKLREIVHQDAKCLYKLIAADADEPNGIRIKAREEACIEEALELEGHAVFKNSQRHAPHPACVEAIVYHVPAALAAMVKGIECEAAKEHSKAVCSDPNVSVTLRLTHACSEATEKVHESIDETKFTFHIEALREIIHEALRLVIAAKHEHAHNQSKHLNYEQAKNHALPWPERLTAASHCVSESVQELAAHSSGGLRKAQIYTHM